MGLGAVTSAVATLTILNPFLPDEFNPGSRRFTSTAVYHSSPTGRQIIVGGYFSALAGQSCNYIGRLNAERQPGHRNSMLRGAASAPICIFAGAAAGWEDSGRR